MTTLHAIGEIRDAELEGLRAEVEACAGIFGEIDLREKHPASPHTDTQTLYLRMPPHIDVQSMFNAMDCEDWPLMERPMFRWAVDEIAAQAERQPARAMVVRLKAGGMIRLHSDQGPYAEATRRYHLAITTNPECVMQVGYAVASAPAGSVYFFDKSLPHAVFNCGDSPRDHLIVDVWK